MITRSLVTIAIVALMAACGGTTTGKNDPAASAAATAVAGETATATIAELIEIVRVTEPQLAATPTDLEWTSASFAITARNDDDAAHEIEIIAPITVTPRGQHGPGWGKRRTYQTITMSLPANGEQTADVMVGEVFARSRVSVGELYVREIDGTIVDDRRLPAAE
jgi:hypothetical protein